MSWLLYNGNKKRRKMPSESISEDVSRKLVLNLRDGIAPALITLSNLRQGVDHVIVRQSPSPTREQWIHQEDLNSLFRTVSQLSNLKTIEIADFEQEPLPASCLIIILRHALQLSSLRFVSVCLSGNQRDFDCLLPNVFQCHPSLERIYFSTFTTCSEEEFHEDHEDSLSILAIAKALSAISTLTSMEIVETYAVSICWTGEVLSEICKSESLRKLRIRGPGLLKDEDVALIADTVQANRSTQLQELWILACELGYGNEGTEAIARMLHSNSTLRVLGLNQLTTDEQAINISSALKGNRTLKGLHLSLRDGFTSSIYASLVKITEENYTLEKLSGGLLRNAEQEQIDFYLQMNRDGRKLLLEDDSSTKRQWLDALSLRSDNVSVLFYLLSRNPSLCGVE